MAVNTPVVAVVQPLAGAAKADVKLTTHVGAFSRYYLLTWHELTKLLATLPESSKVVLS